MAYTGDPVCTCLVSTTAGPQGCLVHPARFDLPRDPGGTCDVLRVDPSAPSSVRCSRPATKCAHHVQVMMIEACATARGRHRDMLRRLRDRYVLDAGEPEPDSEAAALLREIAEVLR